MCMVIKGINMAKVFILTVLLANLMSSNCQVQELAEDSSDNQATDAGNPSYSFSYGVSDARTGDIKSVWESKEGDTVKGHYSVLEPDGSMRTVEYSAAPDTGFTAVVNSESATTQSIRSARTHMEDKAMRDYDKYYDFSEDEEDASFIDRKKTRRPQEHYKEHSRRRPQYPDLEPSEYTHSISIKHPYDESLSESEPHSHVGYSFDANCKTKHKKESYDNKENYYGNYADLELNKHKYPAIFSPDPFKENYNKFAEPSDFESEKVAKFGYNNNYQMTKFDEDDNIKPSSSIKYNYPILPEIPPPDRYENDDYRPPRPKKKLRPHKQPDFHYSGDDLDEYVLVPKKKYKPTRTVEPDDYRPEIDDDYERPHYNNDDDHDDRYQSPPRPSKPKEIVRKIVKKRRPPVINLLDIFDI